MSASTTDLLDRVLEITVLLGDDLRQALGALGLTETKAHALHRLATRGPTVQRALAETLGVSPRAVTGLVDGLVEAGLVTREPEPGDRRAARVTLTAAGDELATGLVAGQQELGRALFGHLSAADRRALAEQLTGVVERLRGLLAEAARP